MTPHPAAATLPPPAAQGNFPPSTVQATSPTKASSSPAVPATEVSEVENGRTLSTESAVSSIGPTARWTGARTARTRGLHGQIVQRLGEVIVGGRLGANQILVPDEIGQRFDVSRTAVRESLRVLETKGLVRARPNTGTRVQPITEWNLLDDDVVHWRASGPQRESQRRELLELLTLIDPLAARLAAGKSHDSGSELRLTELAEGMARAAAQGDGLALAHTDSQFHSLLVQASGNRMLERLEGVVSAGLKAHGERGCNHDDAQSIALHRHVATAVAEGDSTAAEAVMRQLLIAADE